MKQQMVSTRRLVTNQRYTPLAQMDATRRRYAMQVLGWVWSAIFALSLLSLTAFGYAWISYLLVIGGVFVSISVISRAKARRKTLSPVPNLSGASKCVWQMDREA